MNSEVRTQIVTNALRVDSLQQIVNKQNLYIMNIQDIFSGKVKADTVVQIYRLADHPSLRYTNGTYETRRRISPAI